MEQDNLMKTGEPSSLILEIKTLILILGEKKKLIIFGVESEML